MGLAVMGALLVLGGLCWFVSKALSDGDDRVRAGSLPNRNNVPNAPDAAAAESDADLRKGA
jgi:hypothetical protein